MSLLRRGKKASSRHLTRKNLKVNQHQPKKIPVLFLPTLQQVKQEQLCRSRINVRHPTANPVAKKPKISLTNLSREVPRMHSRISSLTGDGLPKKTLEKEEIQRLLPKEKMQRIMFRTLFPGLRIRAIAD